MDDQRTRSQAPTPPAPILNDHQVVVACSIPAICFWWVTIALLLMVSIAYFAFAASFYRWLPTTLLGMNLEYDRVTMAASAYPSVATVHACIAACHSGSLVYMVLCSLYSRRFELEHEQQWISKTPFGRWQSYWSPTTKPTKPSCWTKLTTQVN